MKTRILHTKIWKDGYFRTLLPDEKIVFIWLLTNEYVNQIWLYECPDDVIAFETSIKLENLHKIKQKLQKDGKVAFYNNYIYLVNASKYENYKGELNDKAKDKIKSLLSKPILDWYNSILDRGIHRGIEGVYIPIINNNKEILSNKKEDINNKNGENIKKETIEEPTIPERLINLFNHKTGRVYKLTEGRKKQISLRLKTFTPEEIAQAIIKMLDTPFYKGQNATRWEADPDFILRNDEQIDKFLGKTKQLQITTLASQIN